MKPHHVFADDCTIDPKAMHQFYEALKQPWVVAGAVMPDIHAGYSLPIGSVIATDDVVVPAYVGFDIGCGVCAAQTSLKKLDLTEDIIDQLYHRIYQSIPTGEGKAHATAQRWEGYYNLPRTELADRVWDARNAHKQFGTLGGGNHFIEVGSDEQDRVWVIIHSGSRGFGHGIATEYMKIASGGAKAKDGHYALSVHSDEGKAYIKDMQYALEYALDNRIAMMERIEAVMQSLLPISKAHFCWDTFINRNHNHAVFRQGMWVHRKGATEAEVGMPGVIPGNMRDGSYIIKGLGNPDSLWSSSHGAGRVMGRNQAKKEIDVADFESTMQGIKANVSESTLDESPFAYKNIFEVMAMQKDLVEVVHLIKPILNVKG